MPKSVEIRRWCVDSTHQHARLDIDADYAGSNHDGQHNGHQRALIGESHVEGTQRDSDARAAHIEHLCRLSSMSRSRLHVAYTAPRRRLCVDSTHSLGEQVSWRGRDHPRGRGTLERLRDGIKPNFRPATHAACGRSQFLRLPRRGCGAVCRVDTPRRTVSRYARIMGHLLAHNMMKQR